jgi:hypothetical protein
MTPSCVLGLSTGRGDEEFERNWLSREIRNAVRELKDSAPGFGLAASSLPTAAQTAFNSGVRTLRLSSPYLAVGLLLATACSAAARNGWDIIEKKSKLDDSPQVFALLSAVEGGTDLVLRCREKETEAFLTKDYTIFGSTGAKVNLRINGGKATEEMWQISLNGKYVVVPDAIEFIQSLPENGTLYIRVTSDYRTEEGVFKLGNVSNVRNKIARTCNWHGSKTGSSRS